MTQVNEQPKPKPRRTHHRAPRRERGLPLTIWIVVVAALGVLTAVQGVLQESALGVATSAFVFVCAWGLWNWQRWAYYALLVAIAIAGGVLLVALFSTTQNLVPFLVAVAAGAVTFVLIHPRLEEFR